MDCASCNTCFGEQAAVGTESAKTVEQAPVRDTMPESAQEAEPEQTAEATQTAEEAAVEPAQEADAGEAVAEPAPAAVTETAAATAAAPTAVSGSYGSIKAILSEPLINVPGDAMWISVIGMYMFLLPVLISGIVAGLCPTIYVCVSIGSCLCPCFRPYCSILGHIQRGRPLCTAFVIWRGMVATLIALIHNSHSRLALFIWEWKAFGSGRWFWHGEGVWCHSYEDCDRILQGAQDRKIAFGAVKAPAPDLYPEKLMIFLPNAAEGQDCEWAAIRRMLHQFFLNQGDSFQARLAELPTKLARDWTEPKLADLSNLPKVRGAVSKCLFYMFFEVWPTEAEATTLAQWRDHAAFFILPRLIQRVAFNLLIKKVKKLRTETVGLLEKHGKMEDFVALNESLGPWKRDVPMRLADEITFAMGFAGIGGTCAAVESVGAFLQVTYPAESPGKKYIKWGDYGTSESMVQKYWDNPERYIRETCRMDPPVTSATSSLPEDTNVTLAGKEFKLKKGTLNQYVLSMANRDETLFPQPDVFNPDRANLEKALTWNGAFGAENEDRYPRICPGRHLSLKLVKMIVSHALGPEPATTVGV